MKRILITLMLFSELSCAENLYNSNRLFDFAEQHYASYFGDPGAKTFRYSDYWMRYYAKTNTYLGTNASDVYVYGDLFSGLVNVGKLTDFIDRTVDTDTVLQHAFTTKANAIQVTGTGVVKALLPDDTTGSRHQRFIIKLNSGQTLLIAHNIDLAARIPDLTLGDTIEFYGEYVWNEQGGLIHWTHDDAAALHPNGWIMHHWKIYGGS